MKKLLSAILSTMLLLTFASAQTKTTATTTKKATTNASGMLVATVNVYNATTTKISNGEYSVSFQIYNRVGTQSNIRYGLELVNSYDQKIADTQLANESLTLGNGQSIDLKMDYKVPSFVSIGNYKLRIVVKNQNGLALATMPAGFPEQIITVETKAFAPTINSCSITLNSTSTKYTNSQMLTVNIGEQIKADCEIENKGSSNYSNIQVKLITHKKSSFGDIVDSKVLENKIVLNNNSKGSISLALPIMNLPQLYYVEMFLVDEKGNKLSTSIPLYYFVKGDSITLQNVVLNKSGYKKGDKANLDVFWTYAGDNPQNSFTMKAIINNGSGALCGSITKSIMPSDNTKNTSLQIPISMNCENALISVSVLDNKGNILDSTDIDTKNQKENVNIDENTPIASILAINSVNKYYVIIFIAVLVLIGYGILVLKKEHKDNTEVK